MPWDTAVTVVGWTPSSRAICDSELPATRKRILMRSWRFLSLRKVVNLSNTETQYKHK